MISISSQSDVEKEVVSTQKKFTFNKELTRGLSNAGNWAYTNEHVANEPLQNTSQFQTQLNMVQSLLESVQTQQQADVIFMSVLHVEMSELGDGVILTSYNTYDQIRIRRGETNIMNHLQTQVIYFDEFYTKLPASQEQIKQTLASRQDALTKIIPQIIQELDPDFIFSWKTDKNGLGQLCIEAATFGFDLAGAISRTPSKHSEPWLRLGAIYKDTAKMAGFMKQKGMNQVRI